MLRKERKETWEGGREGVLLTCSSLFRSSLMLSSLLLLLDTTKPRISLPATVTVSLASVYQIFLLTNQTVLPALVLRQSSHNWWSGDWRY